MAANERIRWELWLALREAEARGTPQWRIAQEAGINPDVLSRIVNRRRQFATQPPAPAVVEAIARALDRPIADLFSDLEDVDVASAA
jgi:hypothetical protein